MTFAIPVHCSTNWTNEQTCNWKQVIMLVPNKPVYWWINDCESDLRSYEHYLSRSENKAWEVVIMLFPNKPVKWWFNNCEYKKIISVNWGFKEWIRSDEHYFRSTENKTWKKISGLYGIWTHDLCHTGAVLVRSVRCCEDRFYIHFLNRSLHI